MKVALMSLFYFLLMSYRVLAADPIIPDLSKAKCSKLQPTKEMYLKNYDGCLIGLHNAFSEKDAKIFCECVATEIIVNLSCEEGSQLGEENKNNPVKIGDKPPPAKTTPIMTRMTKICAKKIQDRKAKEKVLKSLESQ